MNNHISEYKRIKLKSDSNTFTYIGEGKLGGKASGLAKIHSILENDFPHQNYKNTIVSIPKMTVLLTNIFEEFMSKNKLWKHAITCKNDSEILNKFLNSSLPISIVGDLYYLIKNIQYPLAVRSSSMLEDSLEEPFAGIYQTKMIPNNSFVAQERFNQLTNAIKFVYASLFFQDSKNYFKAIKKDISNERMAVIIQQVIGDNYDDLYYPTISGVAKSYNFYPTCNNKCEDGVIYLALGLGKTIVDGGYIWSYCPASPASPPPLSESELIKYSQSKFWSINLGKINKYSPNSETEFLEHNSIRKAEEHGTLPLVATKLRNNGSRWSPWIMNFAQLLKWNSFPLNEIILQILSLCQKAYQSPIEIEFAIDYNKKTSHINHFGLLQVRPMLVSKNPIEIKQNLAKEKYLLKCDNVLGNGYYNDIEDIIYVKKSTFNANSTRKIAQEISLFNKQLLNEGKAYLLIGFGRWGSSDPWLGIPVNWSDISGAKVIIESSLENMNPDFSQGSHFFHNITGLGVLYFSIKEQEVEQLDWDWIAKQNHVHESEFVSHIKLKNKLQISVDGRVGKGVILK